MTELKGEEGRQLRKPKHQCSINASWQVLPFGESKGSCGPRKKKGVKKTTTQVYILKKVHQVRKVFLISRDLFYNKDSSKIQCWFCATGKIHQPDVRTDLETTTSLSCISMAQCTSIDFLYFFFYYLILHCISPT